MSASARDSSESRIDGIWREIVARMADAPAIHVEPEGRTWSFAEIEAGVAALHESLRARTKSRPVPHERRGNKGANPWTHEADAAESALFPCAEGNTVAFVVDFLAARRAGRIFVAIDRTMPPEERQDLLDRIARGGIPPETAVIKVTSGSTGKAKGVALTEAGLLAGVRNIVTTMKISLDDVNLAAISLSHSYGFDNLVLPLIIQGTPMALLDSFTPRAALDAIARRRVTFVPLVPVMYESLSGLCGDWSSVRRCISAGSPLDPALARRFHDKTNRKIHTFYGASECGGIAFDRSADPAPPRGSVGTALDGVRIDLAGDGRVRVHSESVALGPLPPDAADPWQAGAYVTGDLGRFDDAGALVLTGRAKDVINVAGRKVAAAEIETCLLGLRGAAAAAVVGLAVPVRGEAIGALVAASSASGLTEARVLAHCRESLPAWKVPRVVRIVEELPRDARGKVSRVAVRCLLESR